MTRYNIQTHKFMSYSFNIIDDDYTGHCPKSNSLLTHAAKYDIKDARSHQISVKKKKKFKIKWKA